MVYQGTTISKPPITEICLSAFTLAHVMKLTYSGRLKINKALRTLKYMKTSSDEASIKITIVF